MATPREELEQLRALVAQQAPVQPQQVAQLSPRQELEQLRALSQQQAPEQPSFPGASFIEPAATLISGAIAEPVAGLAGLARTAISGPEAGAEAVILGCTEIGLLVSREEGTTRTYYFKQSPISDALRVFLRAMIERLPDATIEEFFRQRRRPRRFGKQ